MGEDYVGNILDFSTKVYTKELDKRCIELQEMYDAIKLCYDTIEALEKKLLPEEQEYDRTFATYVHKVGIEAVEVKYIEFVSSDIAVNVETGEIKYLGPDGEENDTEV